MRAVLRMAAVWVACCTFGLCAWSTSAVGAVPSQPEEQSSLGSLLVVPGMQFLIGGQQTQAAEEAMRNSPEAFTARQVSRTSFEGMNASAVDAFVRKAFPELTGRLAGTLPDLPAGQKIVGYPTDDAAQVELGGGKHGVIESMEPIAIETSPGHHDALDLGLDSVSNGFQPVRSDVGVHIPARLGEGVRLSETGISLTPVDAGGSVLVGSEGVADGATILYANTQIDSDTVVKPLTSGFEEDTLLRSIDSPSRLSFHMGLPVGATLVSAGGGSGTLDVLDEGAVIAAIPKPTAQDAEGVAVPVSTSISGHTLVLNVDRSAGSYRYPIMVDPTVVEGQILYPGGWGFFTENASIFKAPVLEAGKGVEDIVSKTVGTGERAFFYYRTQGQSRIYAISALSSFEGFAGSKMEDVLGIENVHTGSVENSKAWLENYAASETVCALAGCATGTVTESTNKSEVFFRQNSREANEWGGGTAKMSTASVDILQEAGPSSNFVPIEKWVKNELTTQIQLKASDPGTGIYSSTWYAPSRPEWKSEAYVFGCVGVQCEENDTIWGNLRGLPEGEDVVEAVTKDAVGLSSTAKTIVKIDDTKPYNFVLTGFPASREISFGHYVVKVSANDGSGTTPSAGVSSIALAIDGKEVGSPKGSCTPGPCTATGEWMVNGEEYAAGKHTFTMTATDGAGNVAKEEFQFTIDSSETKPVGPGVVDLTSGAYMLNATDVAIAAPGGELSVKRSYNSRHLTSGAEGPLGPQWSGLGLGGTQSLTKLPTGSMLLTAANGRQSVFAKEGTKFLAPTGDSTMSLQEESTNTFVLTEQNGTVTTFTLPAGGSGTLFMPSSREEKGYGANTVKYTFQTVAGITEPTEALAPVPAGVSCTTLVKGCRALTFNYATSTTATGESESQWGDYAGRLTRVYFTAWDPAKSEMTTTTVAQYSYDSRGRLRAEWDPRITPALKTIYGYDYEGHLTTLTNPGQETWVFTYASISRDPNTGRLMKVMQAPAATALWNGQTVTSTEAPKVSGTAMVGIRMAVSTGSWSNGALTYGYQWDRCNAAGGECVEIAGAMNPNYTPVEADTGHALIAVVTASNGGGSVAASSSATIPVVANGVPSYVSSIGTSALRSPASVAVDSEGDLWVADTKDNQVKEFNESGALVRRVGSAGSGIGQFKEPKGIAVGHGSVWVADTGNNRLEEFSEGGTYMREVGTEGTGNGKFKSPVGLAVDSKNNVWVADSLNNRVQEIGPIGEYITQFGTKGTGNGQFVEPEGVAIDSKGNIWVADTSNNRIQEFNEKGEYQKQFGTLGEGNGSLSHPDDIFVDAKGNPWVADTSNNRVQEFNEKGEYLAKFGSKGVGNGQFESPAGVTVDAKGDVWVADTSNNRAQEFVEKAGAYVYSRQFGSYGTANGQFLEPGGIATDSKGNVWVADLEGDVQKFNEKGEYLFKFGSKGTGNGQFEEPIGIATDSKGNAWVVDTNNDRVEEFNESGTYVSKFGAKGTAGGQFEYPWGAAIDSKGHFWITDSSNYRVEELNEKGEFIETFGFGVSNGEAKLQTCTSSCHAGISGEGAGQFVYPEGIAVDAKGHIWVADTYSNRLEEFNEKGEVLAVIGTTGEGNGQFDRPVGVSVDSSGNVWVSDTENNRIQEFNEKGEFKIAVGAAGEGAGQFDLQPNSDLSIDAKGNLWVVNGGVPNVEHWLVLPKVEAEAVAPSPGYTVSYSVPVSGTEAPTPMGNSEVEKWGQKDYPVEASAIFPPDEPQGSPASNYRRASVYYLDNRGRTVNTLTPGGAVSTSEYNTTNDVVRTLSPDNRAAAVKEGSKSAEVSKLLDTESTYNEEGTELLSATGPRHAVKLSSGKEVQARSHTAYSYDEEAPAEGSPYRLETKITQGALVEGEAEQDVRTTTTSYSGQENLGWKLRKPTSVSTDPSGLDLTSTVAYDPTTGNAIETRTPSGSKMPLAYSSSFGSAGTGNGQFRGPADIATDSSGNMWVSDIVNNRLEEFNSEGAFLRTVGSAGNTNGKFKGPEGLATDSKGDVWVADSGNGRLQEFSSEGVFIRTIGSSGTASGQFKSPEGITIDAKGNLWVADRSNNRVQEFNPEGAYMRTVGLEGTGNGQLKHPSSVGLNSEGNLYVLDQGNHRIQEFGKLETAITPTYTTNFGSEGTGSAQLKSPWGMTTDSSGDVWVADTANNRVEEFGWNGSFLRVFGSEGTANGQFKSPEGIFTDASGHVWVTDTGNNRVQEFTTEGTFVRAFGSAGTGTGQFKAPEGLTVDSKGDVWVADSGNNRIQEFSAEGAYMKALGSEGTGNGQFKAPSDVGFSSEGNLYVLDHGNNRIQEFNASSVYVRQFGALGSGNGQMKSAWRMSVNPEGYIWLADSSNNRVEEFSLTGEYLTQVGSEGTGNGQFKTAGAVSTHGAGLYVLDRGNDRVENFTILNGEYIRQFGSEGSGNGQMKEAYRLSVGPENNVWLADSSDSRIEEFSGAGEYMTQFGSAGTGNGQFKTAASLSVQASSIYVIDQLDDRVEKLARSVGGSESAHDTRTIYYTTAANTEYPGCGGHAEWANLPCETKPVAQPGTSGLPELPVTTTTYNVLDEPEVTTQTVGAVTRTTKATYDAVGRMLTSSISSSVGTALPTVTYEYNTESGAQVKQSTTVEGKTQSISQVFNKIGNMTSYTDASGNVSTFEYEPEGDARLIKASDGKGTKTYTYNETTGALSKLVDSAAGTFTASYDVEGTLTSEGYPNGMSANYSYNQVGEGLGLEYVKTTHCSEKCTWYSDVTVPSIHGQTVTQTSSLASQSYSYDNASRLTQVQETVGGKCLTRIYGYDEDTNRTSVTTREPGAEGKCATEGGVKEAHEYDSADRLIDGGTKYETFGNITSLPAADAGGTELTSSFYTDNRLASQTQNGETIGYQLDPARRVNETISTGKVVATVTNHYAGAGGAPAWTSEVSGKWVRNIEGIGVGLVAIQNNGETPVLQLTDLKGNIVATAAESEVETKLLGTNRTTEYGVPTTEAPPKYSWLGAHETPTELPSGVIGMGVRSYVPQLGRFLQTDPRPGGSANAYAYTYGDPVNTTDLSGEYTIGGPSQALIDGSAQAASEAAAEQAAINAAARAEAERKAAEAAGIAGFEGEEEWEEEEWEEEEGEEEYAAYHGSRAETGLMESGLLWTSSQSEAGEREEGQALRFMVAKRKARKKAAKCMAKPTPSDPDRGCCGNSVCDKTCGSNYPCPPSKDPHASPIPIDCPEGSTPYYGPTGKVWVCIPADGKDDPNGEDTEPAGGEPGADAG
jgi:RHS repeat-associated protein